jgi:hypothetical protein
MVIHKIHLISNIKLKVVLGEFFAEGFFEGTFFVRTFFNGEFFAIDFFGWAENSSPENSSLERFFAGSFSA